MRGIILSALIAVASCAKLDNTYLPPPNAKTAGGNEDSLELPLEPPYIDPYSGNEPKYSYGAPGQRGRPKSESRTGYKPNQYGRNVDFDKVNNLQGRKDDFIEDEDEIRNVNDASFPRKSKSRFLSGSYSYTGPDNVLVTVTYTADRGKGSKQGRKLDRDNDDDDEQQRRSLDQGVIPTPPSLPENLRKAFDFHEKNRSQQGRNVQDGKEGYHYGKPQGRSRSNQPGGDEGYSYPKPGQ